MNPILPEQVFFTRGAGQHKEKLVSFELALREAGIAPFNLVKVSSILPPHCIIVPPEEGRKMLSPGQVLFLVLSENCTTETDHLISASIGAAIPNNSAQHGYLSEYHTSGHEEKEAGHHAEDLAAYMLATILTDNFDDSKVWNEEKSTYKISENITVRTQHITQTAKGQNGLWTTVVAAAVLIT